jgi:hypothetical protein
MSKDTERNRYFTIAVPKESQLLQKVEAECEGTNIRPGQLIVLYATKYLRLKNGNIPIQEGKRALENAWASLEMDTSSFEPTEFGPNDYQQHGITVSPFNVEQMEQHLDNRFAAYGDPD